MEKDIIVDALYRFQQIVDSDRPSIHMLESDRRLARLAIKKYTKTVAWRASLPRFKPDRQEVCS
ncbi:uncharacterized protein Dvar_21790 [Desulfosarcina variabilis str. Montpellier]|uniref:hypothetical protein n=1 Tax=Desulfosarcina variabilis TaxID=2300 RepID=UPI003AFAAAFF